MSRISFSKADNRIMFVCAVIVLIALVSIARSIYNTHTIALPADGGSFIEGTVGRINDLNPVLCAVSNSEQDVCSLVFSGLTRFDATSNEVWGDLAYRWDVSPDGKLYTFFLRKNALWHDGLPVTADDVVFTYQDVLQSPDFTGLYKSALTNTAVTKLDEHTVQFTLKNENAFFPGFLTIGLLPKHLLGETPIRDIAYAPFNKRPIGTGMYMLNEWTVNETFDQIDLLAFDRYYDTMPHIRKISFYAFNNFDDLYARIGTLDGIRALTPSEGQRISTEHEEFEIHPLLLNRYVSVLFNTARPALKNPQARRGLRYAINPTVVEETVPYSKLINSPVPHLSTGSHTYDIDKAKEEMYYAGWKIFSDKYADGFRRNDKQEKLTLRLVTTTDESLTRVAQVLREEWNAIGIDVIVESYDIETLETQYLTPRDYDVLLIGQGLGSDLDLYSFWHSLQTIHPGLNLAQYKSADTDLLIEKIRKTHDSKEQLALTKQLSDKIQMDAPAVFLYTPYHLYATRKDAAHIVIAQNIGHVYDRFALIGQWFTEETHIWQSPTAGD